MDFGWFVAKAGIQGFSAYIGDYQGFGRISLINAYMHLSQFVYIYRDGCIHVPERSQEWLTHATVDITRKRVARIKEMLVDNAHAIAKGPRTPISGLQVPGNILIILSGT